MEDKYYVIPLPKYDDTKEYRTAVSNTTNIFAIPLTSQRMPQAVVALEFLCAYSQKDVTPLFFENVLKGKYTRDPNAAETMDLICQNVYGDFISIWSSNIDRIDQLFYDPGNVVKNKLKLQLNNKTIAFHEYLELLDDARESLETETKKLDQ